MVAWLARLPVVEHAYLPTNLLDTQKAAKDMELTWTPADAVGSVCANPASLIRKSWWTVINSTLSAHLHGS